MESPSVFRRQLQDVRRQEARAALHELLGMVLVEDQGKRVVLRPQADAALMLLKAAGAELTVSNIW